ncbi:uncharacterized protein HGUI_02165 [Hanseniaspora guilliermondii]|uniref:SIN1-type PH domain-containing protein n=1 Tax=Hanseniaspora guilliermondii TaxID=56406 RepID=A0A1L0CM61_9ASCO|nr:uncharacterized protein HGUI_02165 [Hanseniaspora guilliermondii]
MDEVYLINELRASFLKYSDEISKTRVIDPYQADINDTKIHSLYIDPKTGKDYFKIVKSPSINDDYFNVIADETRENINETSSKHTISDFHSIKENQDSHILNTKEDIHTPRKIKRTIDNESVSRRSSLNTLSTNMDQSSTTSKMTTKTSRSKLRLSRLSGFFHKRNGSDSESNLHYMKSNNQNNKLFKTRSKSASLFSNNMDMSSNNSITQTKSRNSSDILRRGVDSIYRKISNSSAQSFNSNESAKLSTEDKYLSKTTSFLKKGKNLFHFKHNPSSKTHGNKLTNKSNKPGLGKNYSTQLLEEMMYTDQLFREGEIPDNFDDSEEEEEDDDSNTSGKSSSSIKKSFIYSRTSDKTSGKNHEKDDSGSIKISHEGENRNVSNNSLSYHGNSYSRKLVSHSKESGTRGKTNEPIATINHDNYDSTEDSIFNFKKISKRILPSTNNNNSADINVEDNSISETSLVKDSLEKSENQRVRTADSESGYPKESFEIDSFLEDGKNLDKVLNFDKVHISPVDSLRNSLPSVINQPISKTIDEQENTERYYGDLASSFGESLIDDDYEDDLVDSVGNSVPLKNRGFLLSKDGQNSFDSLFSVKENTKDLAETMGERDMVDYFAKKTDFDHEDERKASNLTNFLKPNTATKIKFQLDDPKRDYESIIDEVNGIELTCYIEGNSMPIELKISMSKKVTNFQLLQLILFKFNLQDEIDHYMLRIVDEDGLPFEGNFGILKLDDMVDRSLMMEELVACKIENDPGLVERNKKYRIEHAHRANKAEEVTNNLEKTDKRVLILHSNENSFANHIQPMKVETKDLDTIGEVVSRFCLYNDVDPKKYYLRIKQDVKHYLPNEITLGYFFKSIYNPEDIHEVISIKESRQTNLRKLPYDIDENERDGGLMEDANINTHLNGLTPFTLNNAGDYLPLSSAGNDNKKNMSSKTGEVSSEGYSQKLNHKQRNTLNLLNKQPDKLYNNGVPLNLNEIYYRYTIFRRQHQKVSLLTNKQLKTLMIDGDFIYLVDCDFNTAPMMTDNEFKAENSVYGFGGNSSAWDTQQFLKNKNNAAPNDDIATTKTFHVSQIIQIEKSSKNRTHFKIKFIRAHGPKWYYFETLSSSDRDEIITKLAMLKAIYNRNK